ncbi:MAG: alpha/beta hydrolase [Candidatus Roizmanbacteria bacterium]|nr:alpha/beta hydrolase [Candidatus Roizmanbacteria bacterium]
MKKILKTQSFELAIYTKGNTEASKLALVLPGKLDTKDYPHMRSHVEYLAKRGYYALSFDPPGTWESKGDISLYTVSNYQKAVNEIIEYFSNRPTFLVGHSRGGSIAMLAGTANPYVHCFASIMSFYTFLPTIHGEYPDNIWKKKGYTLSKRDIPGQSVYKVKLYKLPYSFLEDQIMYDMSSALSISIKPKLFIFGTKDTLVTPEIVKKGYDISAEPKQIKELNSDHNYRSSSELIQQVNKKLGEFLDSI